MTDLFAFKPESTRSPTIHSNSLKLRCGSHLLEVRSIATEASLRYLGLYDGAVSVSAPEPHVALQMLLRRHFRARLIPADA
jgi:hypothetical protein